MTTSKSITVPAVIHAMLQELSDKNRKKPDQVSDDNLVEGSRQSG